MPRIRVVQVIEAAAGGALTHVLQILGRLPRDDFECAVIASAERNPAVRALLQRLQAEGVAAHEIPMVRPISPLRDLSAFLRLRRRLKALAPDIVHTHASKAGALGRVAAWSLGIRAVVHTPHTFYFEGQRGTVRAVTRAIERRLVRLTRRLVVLSEGQHSVALTALRAEPETVVRIPNAVDAQHFAPAGRRAPVRESLGIPPTVPVIGMIGRFVPQKGWNIFLNAAPLVRRRIPEVRFLLVGHGPLQSEMEQTARDLGLRDAILLHPGMDDPRPLYEAMDVFALTSRYEGMPYVVLEAMAMGLPVVASRIPGNEDVVTPKTGRLISPGDVNGFAEAMIALLKDSALATRLGAGGRERVIREFPADAFGARMADLYRTVAQR